jgi:lipopolysaccharide/colanic/teichoic acid biosynthesis glycosyltransferase/carbonic anhydrase/acetyltransferase-like protein (isoleucine patch superfamily)
MSSEQVKVPPTQNVDRPQVGAAQQAIVVIDRLLESGQSEPLPQGWSTVFANTSLTDLYRQLFAEAGVAWPLSIIPEEHETAFAGIRTAASSPKSISPYNGQLRIEENLLPVAPPDSQPLFLIVNGHQFPLCDLRQAMEVHRNSNCDATFVDLCEPKVKWYDENLLVERDGWVQRVNRVYGADRPAQRIPLERDWPALMVISAMALQKLTNLSLPHRLNQWPLVMLRAGMRINGAGIVGKCFDLHEREQIHELADAILRHRPHWLIESGNLTERQPKVWVGRGVKVPRNAELIGPLAIGDEVEIGEDAVVVGPTVIGPRSRISPGVVVRRGFVPPDTEVGSGSIGLANVIQSANHSTVALMPPRMALERPIRLAKVIEAAGRPRPLSDFRHQVYYFTKRSMDIIGSMLFLAFTLPFYVFFAIAIKINSPGPVFYAHLRQGRGGKNFKCWKFRTMVTNADEIKAKLLAQNEVDGPQFKIKRDPRIFWFGSWLRRLNMDEWPQFFNVLVGDMSLVGPRPSPDRENQMCPAWREARLSVRPGITGLWQVSRKREVETDFQEWIYYDVQYVKKQSIWLDVKILFKTIRVMLKGS